MSVVIPGGIATDIKKNSNISYKVSSDRSKSNMVSFIILLYVEEADVYTKYCAIKRFGHVEEIACLFAYCASTSAGYLTRVDILCDGGLVASGINPLKKTKK